MNTFFAIFGRTVLIILVVGALVGGGIYFGKQMGTSPGNSKQATESGQNRPSVQPTTLPVVAPTSPAKPKSTTVTIKGDDPFGSYSIVVPDGWTQSQEVVAGRTKTTFANSEYKLSISQFAGGGAQCTYPGETGGNFSTPFNTPVGITGVSGQFRRATAKDNLATGPQTFTICQLQSGNYGLPIQFGYTAYSTPAAPTTEMLQTMDAMVTSLKKS